jgi:small subunit ribosomal protein S16
MLTIRLSRTGKAKKPTYRLIISEKTKDPWGDALEILGSYNPFSKELVCKGDRINYWISKGAGLSPTANNLLIDKGIIQGAKIKASKAGKKAAEAAKPAAAAAAPVEAKQAEAPVETAPAEEAKNEEAPAEPKPEEAPTE